MSFKLMPLWQLVTQITLADASDRSTASGLGLGLVKYESPIFTKLAEMDLFSTFLIGFRSKWSDEQMFRRKQQFLEIYDRNYISFFFVFSRNFLNESEEDRKKQNCFGADELKFLKTEGKDKGSCKLLDNGMQIQRMWVQAVPVMGGCNASSWQPTPLDVHALRQFWFMSEPGWRQPLLTDGTPEASG